MSTWKVCQRSAKTGDSVPAIDGGFVNDVEMVTAAPEASNEVIWKLTDGDDWWP